MDRDLDSTSLLPSCLVARPRDLDTSPTLGSWDTRVVEWSKETGGLVVHVRDGRGTKVTLIPDFRLGQRNCLCRQTRHHQNSGIGTLGSGYVNLASDKLFLLKGHKQVSTSRGHLFCNLCTEHSIALRYPVSRAINRSIIAIYDF